PLVFFFSSRRRHTRFSRDWSSDVCSSDLLCCSLAPPGHAPDESGRSACAQFDSIRAFRKDICWQPRATPPPYPPVPVASLSRARSEERRVGKECSTATSAKQQE